MCLYTKYFLLTSICSVFFFFILKQYGYGVIVAFVSSRLKTPSWGHNISSQYSTQNKICHLNLSWMLNSTSILLFSHASQCLLRGIFPTNQIVACVQKGVKCPLTEWVSNATISSSTLQHHLFFCKVRHLSFRLTDVRPTKLYLLRIFDQFPSPYSFTPSSNHFVSSTFHFFLGGTVGSFTLRHLRLVGLDSSAKEIVWC